MSMRYDNRRPRKRKSKRFKGILLLEVLALLILAGSYYFISNADRNKDKGNDTKISDDKGSKDDNGGSSNKPTITMTPEEQAAKDEQDRLKKDIADREDLINRAKAMELSYDYDGAIDLIKSYKGNEGGYDVYPQMVTAINNIETDKKSLVLYGGSYDSVTQFNHIFFHSLVADDSKAFDGDSDSVGYNMYMTTVYEFEKMMQKMYDDGYVLVSIHDIVKQEKQADGTYKFVAQKIYLPQGKKPFVLSQDDVSYYEYMTGDGFASRIVLDQNGKPTTEMVMDDGTVKTGDFDMVPIVDKFVAEHPDFSYKGAKGILALTGYEGVMGYRTNDPTSPTYAQDVKDAKAVADAMKAEGWEFASHGWGHQNAQTITTEHFERDTKRWLDEVEPIVGPTDLYIFPFGVDFETTMGHYKSDKFKFAEEKGFKFFLGVNKEPWMHIKDDYVRMTRRPLDGQAMLQFPERLTDLFNIKDVIDPNRPPRDWK